MKKILVLLLVCASLEGASAGSKSKHAYEADHEDHSLDDLYHDDAADSDVLGDPLLEMDRDEDKFFDDLESLHTPTAPLKPVKPETPTSPKK